MADDATLEIPEPQPPGEMRQTSLFKERQSKLAQLAEKAEAFPNDFNPQHRAAQLHKDFATLDRAALDENPKKVSVAGRIMLRRVMGKSSFITLQDGTDNIQCYIRQDKVGSETYRNFDLLWDIGDFAGIQGQLMRTKTNELTVAAEQIRLLVKALRPLPDKYHGLADTEVKYRQRYLDLIMDASVRQRFELRSKIIASIRSFFLEQAFLEVETPIMHPIAGGATAAPFVTHHNTLDMDMYLRVAPELYLKRLIVGGFERVFEINRSFRNEGLSPRHNPEFTMLEFYQAYKDHRHMMLLTEKLLCNLVETLFGTNEITYQGQTIDFTLPIRRLGLYQSLIEYTEYPEEALSNPEELTRILQTLEVPVQPDWQLGKLQMELFEAKVERTLWQPVFITDYPAEVSPLARRNNDNPAIADRFELFIAGREIANGFSELNDPIDQAQRFSLQVQAGHRGDKEAMQYDEDYIVALEHGMPPTAGEGIGIDRLVMLLTDSPSIRDVLLFPQLKPATNQR